MDDKYVNFADLHANNRTVARIGWISKFADLLGALIDFHWLFGRMRNEDIINFRELTCMTVNEQMRNET